MPLGAAILLVAMLLGALILVASVILSDRKRSVHRSKGSLSWVGQEGRCTTCLLVDIPAQNVTEDAATLSMAAITAIGGSDVRIVEGVAEGWLQPASPAGWFFGWAPQQMAVAIEPLAGETLRFICCSRPRFGTALSDGGRHRKVATDLAGEVAKLGLNRS